MKIQIPSTEIKYCLGFTDVTAWGDMRNVLQSNLAGVFVGRVSLGRETCKKKGEGSRGGIPLLL